MDTFDRYLRGLGRPLHSVLPESIIDSIDTLAAGLPNLSRMGVERNRGFKVDWSKRSHRESISLAELEEDAGYFSRTFSQLWQRGHEPSLDSKQLLGDFHDFTMNVLDVIDKIESASPALKTLIGPLHSNAMVLNAYAIGLREIYEAHQEGQRAGLAEARRVASQGRARPVRSR